MRDEMTSVELTAKLVSAFHQETIRVTESLRQSEQIVAFNDGYQAGFADGYFAAQRDMQKAMGMSLDLPSIHSFSFSEMQLKAWEERRKQRREEIDAARARTSQE